jgi:predicted nucleic acid-binding protein
MPQFARAVADASPLIALHRTGRLALVAALIGETTIPQAVAREIAPSLGEPPPWIRVDRTPLTIDAALAESRLDPGETEVIALALRSPFDAVVLDDRAARLVAARRGLPVIGAAGLLLLARRVGLIESFRIELNALIATGIHIGPSLYRRMLNDAGESIG